MQEKVNKKTTLRSIGWIFTPRTFGARLYLTDDQLPLWNQDDTEGNPSTAKERSSRSVTIVQDDGVTGMRENVTQQEPGILGKVINKNQQEKKICKNT